MRDTDKLKYSPLRRDGASLLCVCVPVGVGEGEGVGVDEGVSMLHFRPTK